MRRSWLSRGQVVLLLLTLLLLVAALFAHRWYRHRLLEQQQSRLQSELIGLHTFVSLAVRERLGHAHSLEVAIRLAPGVDGAQAALDEYVRKANLVALGLKRATVVPAAEASPLFAEGDWNVQPGLPADPEQPLTVEQALAADHFLLGSPIDDAGQPGLRLYRAFLPALGTDPLTLILVFDLPQLLEEAGIGGVGADPFDLYIFDHMWAPVYGSPALLEQNPSLFQVVIADGYWNLAGVPGGGWAAAVRPDLLLFDSMLAVIILLTLGVVTLIVNRQGRLQAAVAARTRELAAANHALELSHRRLEDRVEERTREMSMLLDISHDVASSLDLEQLLPALFEQFKRIVAYDSVVLSIVEEGEQFVWLDQQGLDGAAAGLNRWQPGELDLPIVRRLAQLREPVIIPDVHADTPEAANWRRNAVAAPGVLPEGPACWMGVPLLAKERLVGIVSFLYGQPGYYTEREARLALALANQAAVAIENARLYGQAQTLAALEERQKLARELHDSVSQALYGIGLGASTALALAEQETATVEELVPPLAYVRSLAQTGQAEMRALIFELRPESLEVEGLLPALRRRVEATRARGELEIVLEADGEPLLPVPSKEALYRVTQEALHNVSKHAEASRVWVRLVTENGNLLLEIADDGCGFEMQEHFPGHLGLQSMRERLHGVGGSLTIESAPGAGTRVRARLPVAENR